jgi:hypothetical protein
MNRVSVMIGAMKPMTSGHYNLIKMAINDSLRPPGQDPAHKTFIFISANDRLRKGEFPMYGDEAVGVLNDIYFQAEDFLNFGHPDQEVHFIIAVTDKYTRGKPGKAREIMNFASNMDMLLKTKGFHPESSVDFIQDQRGAPNILIEIMNDPINSMDVFSLYTGKDDINKYKYFEKLFGERFEFAGMGLERTGGGISGTETRELMRRYNSLNPEERERLKQVFPDFSHSSIDDIVKRFRGRAEAEGFKNLMEGIKRREKGTKEYSSYLEEIMNELQHIKKDYGSRKKVNYKFRKEASKIQDAYNEIRKLKHINDRKFADQMLSERAVRRATGYDDYEEKDEQFNRDSIREFFDKFK